MKNELEIFLEQFDKLTLDSRQISKNTVFIAYPGMQFDGSSIVIAIINFGLEAGASPTNEALYFLSPGFP